MSSLNNTYYRCFHVVSRLVTPYDYYHDEYAVNITIHDVERLLHSCEVEWDMADNNKYSGSMVWIGIYIAIASVLCILAMAADLLHGFRNKKFWFPSKYFSLNAASITVITVTMKLPVDLSSEMPRYMDQAAKLGSLAFMCTMMANLMPSLAYMNKKTLLANVIGDEAAGKEMLQHASRFGQTDATFVLGMLLMAEGGGRMEEARKLLNDEYTRSEGRWNVRQTIYKVRMILYDRERLSRRKFPARFYHCGTHPVHPGIV